MLWMGMTLLFVLCARAEAQFTVDTTAAAQDWATDAAYTAAVESGNTDFADAIVNGDVVIFPARLPSDTWGVSWSGGPGEPDVILVAPSTDLAFVGAVAIHEWTHIKNDHPGEQPGCDPTDEEAQAAACRECTACCEALSAIVRRYVETGLGMSCTGLDILMEGAAWHCFWCSSGVHSLGPPGPDPCDTGSTSPSEVPCY